MKKHLALVLALVMVLTSFSFVSAAPDFSDMNGQPSAEAVARLELLNVLKGYPDGTFRPEGEITRAEFAAVAVRISGLEGAAQSAQGTITAFSDVPAHHWASGYVGIAANAGIVNGIGNGLFAPSAPVKYEEAVTMLVRALGFEPEAQAKGGYPYGYLIVANEIGLLDEVKGTQGMPAPRGIVAQIADNALEIPMMIQVGFGADTKWVVSGSKEHGDDAVERYLLDKMGFETYEGRVDKVNTTKKTITLDNEDTDLKLKDVTLDVSDDFDFYAVEFATVKVWYDSDDFVVFCSLEDEVKFDATEIDDDELTLVVEDENYEIAKDAEFYYNGKEVDFDEFGDAKGQVDYAKIVLDNDGDIIRAEGFDLEEFLIFEELDKEVILGYGDEVDAEDFLITKDGKTIALADLVEGDVVYYNATEEFANVYNTSVTGEISRIYTNRFTLDGTDYKATNDQNAVKYIDEDGDIALLADNFEDIVEAFEENGEVAVFLNRFEEMVYVTGDLGDLITTSAYVMTTETSASYNTRGKAMWTLDVINAAGEEVDYDIEAADAVAGDSILFDATGAEIAWYAIPAETVLELKIDKDGDIDEIHVLNPIAVAGPKAQIKTSEKYHAGYKIDTNAPIFLVEDFTTDVDDIEVSTYADLDFDFIDKATFYRDGTKIVSIVIENSDREDDNTTHLTVATADDDKVSGKNIWRLKLVIDGAKVTLDTKEDIADPAVAKHDLLEVKIDNKTGKVNAVSKITGSRVVTGTATDISTSSKSLKVGGNTIKLGADAVVVDATDSYKVISLSGLNKNDTVKALLVASGSAYAEVIVKTAKGGTVVTPPVTGAVTYISAATDPDPTPFKIEVEGKIYTIDANTVLRNELGIIEDDTISEIWIRLATTLGGVDNAQVFDIVANSSNEISSFKYVALGTDKAKAKTVIDMIDALGSNPTEAAVEAARKAYDGTGAGTGSQVTTTVEQQNLVTNLAKLVAAETKIADAAQEILDGQSVKSTIAGLDADSTNLEVATARADYNALTAAGKAEVDNLAALVTAETNLTNAKTALTNKLAAATTLYNQEAATLNGLTQFEKDAITALDAGEPAAYTALVSALNSARITANGFDANDDAESVTSINAAASALDTPMTNVTAAKAAFDALVAQVK